MKVLGFSLLKQPSRSSTLGEELKQMKTRVLATMADSKTAASDYCEATLGRREEKLQKRNLSPLFWMGPDWVRPWALVDTLRESPFPDSSKIHANLSFQTCISFLRCLGNGWNTVSRVLFRRRELTEPH